MQLPGSYYAHDLAPGTGWKLIVLDTNDLSVRGQWPEVRWAGLLAGSARRGWGL